MGRRIRYVREGLFNEKRVKSAHGSSSDDAWQEETSWHPDAVSGDGEEVPGAKVHSHLEDRVRDDFVWREERPDGIAFRVEEESGEWVVLVRVSIAADLAVPLVGAEDLVLNLLVLKLLLVDWLKFLATRDRGHPEAADTHGDECKTSSFQDFLGSCFNILLPQWSQNTLKSDESRSQKTSEDAQHNGSMDLLWSHLNVGELPESESALSAQCYSMETVLFDLLEC